MSYILVTPMLKSKCFRGAFYLGLIFVASAIIGKTLFGSQINLQYNTQLVNHQNTINLAIVTCGTSRKDEALTLIKSAILFSQHTALKVYAFTDNATLEEFTKSMIKLKSDSEEIHANFEYEILTSSFPSEIAGMEPWSQMFKPCALQRLFLPTVLPAVDSLIYMDSDALILSNLTELWNYFNLMNSTQFVGLSPDSEDPSMSSATNKNTPHYGVSGLNSGISLMNLTRMRQFGFQEHIYEIRQKYEYLRPNTSGDQFLQNILYYIHPEVVHVLPCEWNFRHIHCMGRPIHACKSALRNGVSLIHGAGNAFTYSIRSPFFRNIYKILRSYNLKTDNMTSLLIKLKEQFDMELKKCFFTSSSSFYLKLKKYIQRLQVQRFTN